jgi:hypothetical protein
MLSCVNVRVIDPSAIWILIAASKRTSIERAAMEVHSVV